MRALLFVVLLGLIAAGALYVLSGGQPGESKVSNVATTLKEMTSRVVSGSGDGVAAEASEDAQLGLGRWFSKDEPAADGSFKDVYYQYVDDSGTVHFVQNLGDVPAEWQGKAGRIEVERTLPAPGRSGSPAAVPRRAAGRRPAEEPLAYNAGPEVVVYTTAWCGWCRKTLAFLDERGVRYVNKDIEANEGNREELIEKTGRTTIPVVEIDGQIIRGYNAARMEQLLSGSG